MIPGHLRIASSSVTVPHRMMLEQRSDLNDPLTMGCWNTSQESRSSQDSKVRTAVMGVIHNPCGQGID